jgi:PAS domain S-box-containing protein
MSGKGAPDTYETKLLRKDGGKITLEVNATTMEYNGKPADFAYLRNLTERKKAEDAIRESEAQFRNLSDNSPYMILINKGSRIIYANRKFEELMGYTIDEALSPDFDIMQIISKEHRPLIKKNSMIHARGEEVPPSEYTLLTKGGGKLDAIINTKLITKMSTVKILPRDVMTWFLDAYTMYNVLWIFNNSIVFHKTNCQRIISLWEI